MVLPLPMVLRQVLGLLAQVESLERGMVAVLVGVKLAGLLEWLVVQEGPEVFPVVVEVPVAQAIMVQVGKAAQEQQERYAYGPGNS